MDPTTDPEFYDVYGMARGSDCDDPPMPDRVASAFTGFSPSSFYPPNKQPTPAPTESEVAQAFQVPAAVFDLELPWTVKQGRVCNKFGVRIGSFENWEQADAVAAMMNASHQMLETIAAMQTAAEPAVEPAPPAPVEPKSATRVTMETLLDSIAGRVPGATIKFS